MSELDRPTVKKVRDALAAAGIENRIIELDDTARSAKDAAAVLGCDLGAIVKTLVFAIGNRFVVAMIAGDNECLEVNLPKILRMPGKVRRPQASEVKGITGFSIGGVAPVGMSHRLPAVIDGSLKRFETVYAAAGHPHCVFPLGVGELSRLTGGVVSYTVARSLDGITGYAPALHRSKTFNRPQPDS